MIEKDPLIKWGRPKLEVDLALIWRLRTQEHLGWSRGAEEYRKRAGQYISRDTFKRRYLLVNELIKRLKDGSSNKE
ncbi:hypothetical protein ACFLUH_04305 [Chloroflexota bacterium]